MKKILVLGPNGATGKLVVAQLLQQNINVVAILRSTSSLPEELSSHTKLHLIRANITELQEQDLANYLQDCTGVISCLGHNLTLKGVFGEPRLLVTDTIKKVCRAVERIDSDQKIKIILMNTTGNCNHDIPEKPPISQRVVISILRLLLPPHADNEKAADFLRLNIGQNHKQIEWTAVRPDALIDDDSVSEYDLCISPVRNVIFNAASTSRINVANFMSHLVCEDSLWDQWKGKMPVIYNRS
ncbi:MAG: NAD(P)H-binding protein [Proteobacteria bacterium]|nr:NAD(P)H-binding protein [Pseudomonadota bacterium]